MKISQFQFCKCRLSCEIHQTVSTAINIHYSLIPGPPPWLNTRWWKLGELEKMVEEKKFGEVEKLLKENIIQYIGVKAPNKRVGTSPHLFQGSTTSLYWPGLIPNSHTLSMQKGRKAWYFNVKVGKGEGILTEQGFPPPCLGWANWRGKPLGKPLENPQRSTLKNAEVVGKQTYLVLCVLPQLMNFE